MTTKPLTPRQMVLKWIVPFFCACGSMMAATAPLPPGYLSGSPTPAKGATLLRTTPAAPAVVAPPNYTNALSITLSNGGVMISWRTNGTINGVPATQYRLMFSLILTNFQRVMFATNPMPAKPGFYTLSTNYQPYTFPLTLAWTESPDTNVTGYFVYWGGAPRTYTNKVNVTNVTAATFQGFHSDVWYYFAVTAYNSLGLESIPSNEVGFEGAVITNRRHDYDT